MNKLTGYKDTDFIVLMQLNDRELGLVCQVNKYVNSLCNEPQFWLNRIMANFPQYPFTGEEIRKMKDYLGFSTIRELYVYLKSIPEKVIFGFGTGNNLYETKKYIPILIKYLSEQTFIDKVISDNLTKNIPKWFNKEELIYELRRKFPTSALRENLFAEKMKINTASYWTKMKMDLDEISGNKFYTYNNILE